MEYKNDPKNKDFICIKVSACLQKVIMQPKIDQFRVCVFTSYLGFFDETFSPIEVNK